MPKWFVTIDYVSRKQEYRHLTRTWDVRISGINAGGEGRGVRNGGGGGGSIKTGVGDGDVGHFAIRLYIK